ncbi:UNVERIFIED_CONTAM: Ephrin-B1 [Trichonephila clavipes]
MCSCDFERRSSSSSSDIICQHPLIPPSKVILTPPLSVCFIQLLIVSRCFDSTMKLSINACVRFRIDNTDHIIDVNKGNIPFEYDQVSKEEYDSCRITNPASRKIALCDKPRQLMYFTITFRSFTPQPGGLEFRPGQDYYFISTSAGGEGQHALEQKIGGRCATHNMKVIFKVCCGPTKSTTRASPSSSPSTTAVITTTTTDMPAKTTSVYRFYRPTMPPFRPPPPSIYTSKYPPVKSYDFPREEEHGKMPSKKTEDRDKLPNETRAKNEELVKSDANIVKLHQNCVTTVALLLLILYQLLSR